MAESKKVDMKEILLPDYAYLIQLGQELSILQLFLKHSRNNKQILYYLASVRDTSWVVAHIPLPFQELLS